ncbi:MAG: hypothetical protein F6J97_03575 [Leptolyngbya sp. SIO4C1]|nr:hypothetical protein [Leptolyngbya sp. SIO4C1]
MGTVQSGQLILLILNSIIMLLLATLLLGAAWLRQIALSRELTLIAQQYCTGLNKPQLRQLRQRRQQMRYCHRSAQRGTVMFYYSWIVFLVSLLTLALRSLLPFNALVFAALGLFVLGTAGLLLGTLLFLADLHQLRQPSYRSVGQLANRWLRRKRSRRMRAIAPSRLPTHRQQKSSSSVARGL